MSSVNDKPSSLHSSSLFKAQRNSSTLPRDAAIAFSISRPPRDSQRQRPVTDLEMFPNNFPNATVTAIRTLHSSETRETIDQWYNHIRASLRAVTTYSKYMDLTWTPQSTSPTRGFQAIAAADNRPAVTAETQSTQCEALIDLVCSFAPELDVTHVRSEATSLTWIYRYIREFYGCKRTGRQMMSKFSTLRRRDGERLNAFWQRWKGHFAENRIRQGDDIKVKHNGNLITPTEDETGDRYRLSSDIVACLYFAHEDLPTEVEKLLSNKLENQDVASLEQEIFVKANIVLEQLERSRPSVRRTDMHRAGNRSFQPATAGNRSFRPATAGNRSSQPATAGNRSRSTATKRKPNKPEHYCSSCIRANNHDQASSHFIKDCPYLSDADRQFILKLYDRALQHRLIEVQDWDTDISEKFVTHVEHYYGLATESRQLSLHPDDLLTPTEPSQDVHSALADMGLNASVVLRRHSLLSCRPA